MNRLGVEPSGTEFLDWTIDGVALRSMVPAEQRTTLYGAPSRNRPAHAAGGRTAAFAGTPG